ncbi:MAG: ABC transporter ATP-binding protein [Candidatus Bathyarchaeota archaeon]|nr:MAG: ABC transporter ATP-binding protein [Candidatus Bathyarchaeota archaeon]
MSLVIAEDLSKCYGKIVAVDGLSLKVKEGSIMGLIGPNGAGKTTAIKMILGLMKPDEGHVEVFGQNPWDNSNVRSQIGVVYEKPFFPANEKVLNYLERVCRVFGVDESRALEVLKLVDLMEAYDRDIKALSAGMLQKFAIAHAIIHEPKFVIADEITSNLDPKARSSLLDLILQLRKDQKVTFLLSSHILPELSRVCDSVVIINKGKVFASGNLMELYEKFTARTIRVSTDKTTELAEAIKRLPYLEKVETNSQGISVKMAKEGSDRVYEDILRLAREIKAKILGMETRSASLEELYRLVVDSGGQ